MKLYACVAREREEKCSRVMGALVAGWGRPAALTLTDPPWYQPCEIAAWGQIWRALDVIPRAINLRKPWWHIDNGYWLPSRGWPHGYHRVTFCGMSPVLLPDAPAPRSHELEGRFRPWRRTGGHVLIALPGVEYGRAIGLDMSRWIYEIVERVRRHTDRPIKIRSRLSRAPLESDLKNCWALVTHSSNVATDAAMMGVPVFVANTNPAAPVGNLELSNLEKPNMPARDDWWSSLMAQQFTLEEMRSGLAFRHLEMVRRVACGMG